MSSLATPPGGTRIELENGQFRVPDQPIVPFIEGDGIGPDLWNASVRVFDAAVAKCYGDRRRIHWLEVFAGEKAQAKSGTFLPKETLTAIADHKVAIKGPLTTPVGGGMRSLNVTLRQELDLYACIRPVRYFDGVPSPLKRPQDVDVVIFRENTEDVYAGIEWKAASPEARKVVEFLVREMGSSIDPDAAIGIKPMTAAGCKRLVRMAIKYALDNRRKSVTLVHKGNIMKFTEGAFRDWGYEVAREEFASLVVTEDDVTKHHNGQTPAGKLLIKDRIADSMFQQLLLRPSDYDVLATPNLNGDYLSDAAAAEVGGLGLAPGANVGDSAGVFEATHGTAPKYAGQDKSNPGSVILSGCLMLEFMGWREAARSITDALAETIKQKRVTYDLERQMDGATLLKCSQFGSAIIENLKRVELTGPSGA